MAEAEDVITDAALHATKFVQGMWRRHRAHAPTPTLALTDVAQRLDLLIVAVFGRACPVRTAQAPARATFLARTIQRQHRPRVQGAIPATDGTHIWLPAQTGLTDAALALERFRTVALQQAMRVVRGSAAGAGSDATPLLRDLYLLIEAHAADADLARLLPGMRAPLNDLRAAALRARPALSNFPAGRQPLEARVRQLMAAPVSVRGTDAPCSPSPTSSRQMARDMANDVPAGGIDSRSARHPALVQGLVDRRLAFAGCCGGTCGRRGQRSRTPIRRPQPQRAPGAPTQGARGSGRRR